MSGRYKAVSGKRLGAYGFKRTACRVPLCACSYEERI
jgi:hypothetical protein